MMATPVRVVDYVYLGNESIAHNESLLSSLNISAIVNVTWDISPVFKEHKEYLTIPVDDKDTTNLARYFENAVLFIDRHVKNKEAVLVHCQAGVSRSPTIILAYLIKSHKMSLKEAFLHLKLQSKLISPNMGFWRQLVDYEAHILGSNTVQMVPSRIGFIPDILLSQYK